MKKHYKNYTSSYPLEHEETWLEAFAALGMMVSLSVIWVTLLYLVK